MILKGAVWDLCTISSLLRLAAPWKVQFEICVQSPHCCALQHLERCSLRFVYNLLTAAPCSTLKGAVWDLCTISSLLRLAAPWKVQFEICLQSPHCCALQGLELSPTHTHMTGAIMCNTCNMQDVCHTAQRSSPAIDLHRAKTTFIYFKLQFICWNHSLMKVGKKQWYLGKLMISHILKLENSSPKWDSNPYSSIGGRCLLWEQTN